MTTLYSSPDCAYCHMVREYLKKKKEHYKEYDISENPNAYNWVKHNVGQLATPVLHIKNQIIVGFDRKKIDDALAS